MFYEIGNVQNIHASLSPELKYKAAVSVIWQNLRDRSSTLVIVLIGAFQGVDLCKLWSPGESNVTPPRADHTAYGKTKTFKLPYASIQSWMEI